MTICIDKKQYTEIYNILMTLGNQDREPDTLILYPLQPRAQQLLSEMEPPEYYSE